MRILPIIDSYVRVRLDEESKILYYSLVIRFKNIFGKEETLSIDYSREDDIETVAAKFIATFERYT